MPLQIHSSTCLILSLAWFMSALAKNILTSQSFGVVFSLVFWSPWTTVFSQGSDLHQTLVIIHSHY